jgi:predicted amidohydrolase YtcJ
LVTRQTAAIGTQGSEYAIDRPTALRLATLSGAGLLNEPNQFGPLAPNRSADLVAYRVDPTTCPIDQLWDLKPAFTIVGGQAAFDPEGMLPRTE